MQDREEPGGEFVHVRAAQAHAGFGEVQEEDVVGVPIWPSTANTVPTRLNWARIAAKGHDEAELRVLAPAAVALTRRRP